MLGKAFQKNLRLAEKGDMSHRELLMLRIGSLIAVFILLWPSLGQGALYRYVDEHGNVVYSDRPRPGAEKVTPAPLSVVPALPKPQVPKTQVEIEISPATAPQRQETRENYRVEILSPRPDEGVRANDGRITVEVRVEPPPKRGLRLRYQAYLDGRPYGKPRAEPPVLLEEVPRGTHTLEVALLNDKGRELARSQAVTFHVLRVSRLIRPR